MNTLLSGVDGLKAAATVARECAKVVVLSLLAARTICAQTTAIPPSVQEAAYRYAPFIIHEVKKWPQHNPFDTPRVYDHIVPMDFDGDNNASNNLSNGLSGTDYANLAPRVYYAAHETGYTSDAGYYFLLYFWYHIEDDGACFDGICFDGGHPNDLEGAQLIIKKSAYSPYGVLVAATTQAHGAMIPYYNPQQNLVAAGVPAGGAWKGYTMSWTDWRLGGWQRPVVAIRAGTHGSYMAQDCSNNPYGGTTLDRWGMWRGSVELYGNFTACIHDDSEFLLYAPGLQGGPTSPFLPSNQRTGTAVYDLQELYGTSIWYLSTILSEMWGGTRTLFGYDETQYLRPSVYDGQSSNGADAPWNWPGGPGSGATGRYWYTFGEDATGQNESVQNWYKEVSQKGGLILSPAQLTQRRLPYLPDMGQPLRYDPYLISPPDYNTPPPPPIVVAIQGPTTVTVGGTGTWTASVSGGAGGPYQYVWSGIASGTSVSVSGIVNNSDTLYLDVTDSAGKRAFVSLYVQATTCPTRRCVI